MKWYMSITTNLQRMYVIRSLRSGMFCMAVMVLFFKQNGLSMYQITLLQSLFALAVIGMELPTGYFADQHGRKISIIIGGIFSVFGYLTYALSYSFSGFLLGEMFLAAGYCFVSGADSAIIYENTDDADGHGAFIKSEGCGNSAGMISEAVTSFIGGSFLALISLRFPIYFDIVLAFLVIPFAFTLHETAKPKPQHRESSLKKMWRIMRFSLCDHVEIKWLIAYSAVVSTSTLIMVWFIPIYLIAAKTPMFMFGGLWAIFLLVAAFVARWAHRIEESLGRKKSLILLIVLPVCGYALMSTYVSIWAVVFVLFFYITRGMNNPIIKSYINGFVSSEERATIMSVQSLMGRLLFVFMGQLAGWMHDKYSMQIAFMACAIIFTIMGIVSLLFLHKHKAL